MVKLKEKEHEIQKAILEFLQYRPDTFAWGNKTQGTYDPKSGVWRKNPSALLGVSDILGVYRRKFLAIEVKSRTGEATENQIRFLENINIAGGIAFIARSIDEVEQRLDEEDANITLERGVK